ncbi:MAG TPA: hypothetical protein VKX16_10870 [Chloroflexota bacterium]|nr:hypothetical protein [Chloroflexota bacterium]
MLRPKAMLGIVIAVIFAGVAPGTHGQQLGTSWRVFVDVEGRCPWTPTAASPVFCRHTIFGNVAAGNFHLPFRPWGIAYAFNCGSRARNFVAAIGLINLDSFFRETEFSRHAIRGSGFYMETGRANESWRHIIPAYRATENVELSTICAFHVRAVYGRASVVARFVPPVPTAGPPP